MSKKNRNKRTELKTLKCSICKKPTEVDGRCEKVICEDCTAENILGMTIVRTKKEYELMFEKMKGGNENMPEKKIAQKKEKPVKPVKAPAVKKEKVAKADKAERKPKFGPEVEENVIKLFKEGKKPSEIAKAITDGPAVPKIKRILAAKGLLK